MMLRPSDRTTFITGTYFDTVTHNCFIIRVDKWGIPEHSRILDMATVGDDSYCFAINRNQNDDVFAVGYREVDTDTEMLILKTSDTLDFIAARVWATTTSNYGNAASVARDIDFTSDGTIYIGGYVN